MCYIKKKIFERLEWNKHGRLTFETGIWSKVAPCVCMFPEVPEVVVFKLYILVIQTLRMISSIEFAGACFMVFRVVYLGEVFMN